MGIGDIIGGAVGRYGERSWEAAERQRKLEDIGRHANFNALLGHLTTNYENMLPEEHEAVIGKLETIYPGTTKGMLGPLVGGVRSISQIMPAVQSAPTSTPRTSMDQLPTPAETVPSPIAYSPVPAHTIRTPSQTPADVFSQRKLEQERLLRQQRLEEIGIAPIPPHLRQAAVAKEYGVNAIPVITSEIGAESRENIAARRAGEFRGSGRLVIRGGVPLPVKTTGTDELILDPQTNQWAPYTPQQGDEVYEKPTPLGTVQGASDVYSLERAGPQRGTVTPLKVGVRPRATASSGAGKSREFRDVMALRKDFENHPITKQADETARQVKLAEGAVAQGSTNLVAIDQALINVFNKMIDPNSVVREGEYARTIENTPMLNRIKGKVAAIQAGGAGLTPDERRALLDISKRFAADSQAAYGARANEFRRMATDNKWNPNDVVVPRAQSVGPVNPAEAKQQLIDYLKQKKANMQQLPGRR